VTGAAITGLGVSVPQGKLDSADLAERLDVSEDWILGRTGVRSRRIASEEETASVLGTRASLRALEHAGMGAGDLDTIIVATITPDYQFPATASLVQSALGARNVASFDLGAGCSGWLYALAQARALVEVGAARNVLVCGSDVLSAITDYSDPRSCVLFGDGAGAAVVSAVDGPSDFGPFALKSDGSKPELLWVPRTTGLIEMQGREVYKYAVDGMVSSVAEVLISAGITRSGDGWRGPDDKQQRCVLVAHQANARILEAVARRLDWPPDRAVINIDEYGNTSSASIPLALDEAMRTGTLQDGDLLVLAAFGAGFAWGAGTVRWRLKSPLEAEAVREEVARV
jgi:3-oxoacyl-[acyl-carrier-protein] synthase III